MTLFESMVDLKRFKIEGGPVKIGDHLRFKNKGCNVAQAGVSADGKASKHVTASHYDWGEAQYFVFRVNVNGENVWPVRAEGENVPPELEVTRSESSP
jgi:hypothetical protein